MESVHLAKLTKLFEQSIIRYGIMVLISHNI